METHSLNEFKWTTDLVSECCATLILGKGGITSVQDFIDSKMAVSEPVKEKIEVSISGASWQSNKAGMLLVNLNEMYISEDKFPAIKKAIEWELNEVENLDKINTGNYISNLNTNDTEKELERGFTIITSKQSPPPSELKEGKDWEIVSFKHGSSETYFNLNCNGNYQTEKFSKEEFAIDDLLHNKIGKTYLIHSVKRLSDNTEFSNNEVTEQGKIKSFEICGKYMMACIINEDTYINIDSLTKLSTPTQQVVEDNMVSDDITVLESRAFFAGKSGMYENFTDYKLK